MPNISFEEVISNSPLNSGQKEAVPIYKRHLTAEITDFITKMPKFIVAVDGLRRVGKTTVLKQVLNKILDKGFRKVYFFSFDRRNHQTPEMLEQVLKIFTDKNPDPVICLDEIGKIDDWAGVLKKYYDRNQAAFLISGSAAISVKKGKESLAGRMLNYTLSPMGFDEYLELKNVKTEKLVLNLNKPECITQYKNYLEDFLIKGSYPELNSIDDREIINKYIKNSTLEKMIFEDIPDIFKISHKSKLMNIFEYISNYSGDFVQEKSIAGLVGLNEPSTSYYIKYLEESHIIRRIFTEANFAKRIRKTKKVYVASASVYYNTTANFSIGKLNETAIFDKLRSFMPLTYRDDQKREVDFIIRNPKGNIAIEVKSSDSLSQSDLNNLVYYLTHTNSKATGILIYNGQYDVTEIKGQKIYIVPLSTFLASELVIERTE